MWLEGSSIFLRDNVVREGSSNFLRDNVVREGSSNFIRDNVVRGVLNLSHQPQIS